MKVDKKIILDKLESLKSHLSNPSKWMKLRFSDGWSGSTLDRSANSWCLVGALSYVCNIDIANPFSCLDEDFIRISKILQEFNDNPSTTHQDVINLIDKTIYNLKSQI